MSDQQREEEQLKATALQNVKSIQQVRQRADEELLAAKVALEQRARELARSLAELGAVLEATADAILVTGEQGEVVQHNDKLLRVLGLEGQGLVGQSREEVVQLIAARCSDPAAFRNRHAQIFVTAETSSDQFELADGRAIEMFSTPQVVLGSNVGRVWSLRDVTERLRSDVMSGRLAEVVESSDDAILSKDLNGVIQTWNRGAQRIFGWTAAEMIGQPVLRLIPRERHAEEETILSRLRRGERIEHYETVRMTKDGRQIDVSLTVSPIRDSSGRIRGASKVARDITARKRAEAELRRSSEELRALADSIPQLAWIAHADGHVFWFNRGWYEYTGTTLDEVRGWGWQSVHDPQVLPRVLERWHDCLSTGEPFEMEYPLRGQDGTFRWFLTRVRPIRDDAGRVLRWFGTNTDVDEVKLAREALKRAAEERQQLLDAERSARGEVERVSFLKDEFLATLSHELRTPLNAIVGWSQVLRMRGGASPETLEALSVIDRNAKVQAQLIEDLLDMSRIISGKVRLDVQRVDIQDVARAAIASVSHSAQAKEIRFQVVLDPKASPVWGDPGRLQQCFWNLISNAIKFTPKGGKVQVTLARVDSHIALTVTDDGQGISAEFLPHVFERFRQGDASTTRHHGGLGLGLSIVKSLVELHGGSVQASSAGPGQGATFRIELPVMVVDEAGGDHPAARGTATIDQPSLAGITVLAVDDEPDARSLIKRVLEDCGAKVLVAASARQALELLQRELPDLLLSDIGMPDEDGYSLIREVRQLDPERGGRIPAAALSAFARPEDRTRALRAGYQMHLSKPVEPTELVAVVASLAARR